MSIPQTFTDGDQEQFNPNIWNANNIFEVVLRGEWSIDQQHRSINGIEFSFHYARQSNRLLSSKDTILDSGTNRLNFSLLKRLKTRVEQLFLRLK